MTTIDALRCLVAHESGHCVIAAKLGMAVSKIEITIGPDGLDGFSFIEHQHAKVSDFLVMLLAGDAAERDVMGFASDARPHDRSDDQRIAQAIAKVGHGQRNFMMSAARQSASRLIHAHRPTVLNVASALFEKCVRSGQPWDALNVALEGDELNALLLGETGALLAIRRAI
jgi:hypothetical protein